MLKTGIIGLGKVGKRRAEILEQHKHFKVDAICDTNGYCHYEDYNKMLDEENLDCVFICVPHTLTTDIVCDCLHHNLDVFAEKPPGCSGNDKVEHIAVPSLRTALQTFITIS